MSPKNPKNNRFNIWGMLAFWAFLSVAIILPEQAQAYNFYEPVLIDPITGEVCPGPGLTSRAVPCVAQTLIYLTSEILVAISDYFAPLVTIVSCLAVAFLGMQMVGGKTTAPWKDTMVLLVKLAVVTVFSYNLGGWFGFILDSLDQMTFIVFDYALDQVIFNRGWLNSCQEPAYNNILRLWDAVDCTLNAVIGGIYGPFSITEGLAGFIYGCLTSSSMGFAIGVIGAMIMTELLKAVIRSLYVFIGAYIGLCMMALVSPIFIPTILFQSTRGYFERWLRNFLGFYIQPIILFSYLAMLITAFDLVVITGPNSLYRTLVGNAVDDPDFTYPKPAGLNGIGGVLSDKGTYAQGYKFSTGVAINPKELEDKAESFMAEEEINTGTGGLITTKLVPSKKDGTILDQNQQRDILNNLGMGGVWDASTNNILFSPLNMFEFNVPVVTVDWKFLAGQNGFDPADPNKVLRYVIKVLISFMMAAITAYVFTELLQSLPHIGSGLAMSTSVNEKTMGLGGLGRLMPAGADINHATRGK